MEAVYQLFLLSVYIYVLVADCECVFECLICCIFVISCVNFLIISSKTFLFDFYAAFNGKEWNSFLIFSVESVSVERFASRHYSATTHFRIVI